MIQRTANEEEHFASFPHKNAIRMGNEMENKIAYLHLSNEENEKRWPTETGERMNEEKNAKKNPTEILKQIKRISFISHFIIHIVVSLVTFFFCSFFCLLALGSFASLLCFVSVLWALKWWKVLALYGQYERYKNDLKDYRTLNIHLYVYA